MLEGGDDELPRSTEGPSRRGTTPASEAVHVHTSHDAAGGRVAERLRWRWLLPTLVRRVFALLWKWVFLRRHALLRRTVLVRQPGLGRQPLRQPLLRALRPRARRGPSPRAGPAAPRSAGAPPEPA